MRVNSRNNPALCQQKTALDNPRKLPTRTIYYHTRVEGAKSGAYYVSGQLESGACKRRPVIYSIRDAPSSVSERNRRARNMVLYVSNVPNLQRSE